MPAPGMASADGSLVLQPGAYGETHTALNCFDLATGARRWSYPDNFNGVHGSHNACPPVAGMIRGSYGPTGSVKLPPPLGNVWVLPTNVGEWHLLTEGGFYLTRLFEGDPMKVKWPEAAVPGADMSHCPPGMGGEDFGGSITQGRDGKLYVEAGKTAFWNLEVTGLETVRALAGGSVQITAADVAEAHQYHDRQSQAAVGLRRLAVQEGTPKFTGHFEQDFAGAEIARYQKTAESSVRSAATRDAQNLYLAWDVRDATPWVNGAEQPENLYLSGDTVDFQLGTNAQADVKRSQAVAGDLRLSIGNFKGNPTAILYRPVATPAKARRPKTFSSGVVKEYVVADVAVLPEAQIKVTKRADGYLVEAAIPWSALEVTPATGQTLHGDFGVTYGDPPASARASAPAGATSTPASWTTPSSSCSWSRSSGVSSSSPADSAQRTGALTQRWPLQSLPQRFSTQEPVRELSRSLAEPMPGEADSDEGAESSRLLPLKVACIRAAGAEFQPFSHAS